ncbi:hypothetical protein, partial [Endozoicomonas sp. ONNA2]|uniref:hypothetical protein n=1 Tax=Endozoicomonas sp. ONNA2 TaxID=2828741 RepID=UPI0021497B13
KKQINQDNHRLLDTVISPKGVLRREMKGISKSPPKLDKILPVDDCYYIRSLNMTLQVLNKQRYFSGFIFS